MVSGNGLVIGQRAHAETRDIGHAAQIGVEHARSLAIQ